MDKIGILDLIDILLKLDDFLRINAGDICNAIERSSYKDSYIV